MRGGRVVRLGCDADACGERDGKGAGEAGGDEDMVADINPAMIRA